MNKLTSAKTNVDQSNFPAWIPSLVGQETLRTLQEYSSQKTARSEKAIAGALRLANDKRMARVWSEIFKKINAAPREYVHACKVDQKELREVYLESVYRQLNRSKEGRKVLDAGQQWTALNGKDTDILQQLAAWNLYRTAFSLTYRKRPKLITSSEIRARAAPYKKLVKHLRAAVTLLESRPQSKEDREVLVRLAETFDAADWVRPWDNTVFVRNKRNDDQTRAFVIALAEATEAMFGTPLLSTVATISSVILEQSNLSVNRVRSIIMGAKATPVVSWTSPPK